MAIELSKQELEEVIPSLQKFFRQEWEEEIGDLRAKAVLDFFLKEIAPFAYNKGVKDSEAYFRSKVEDLAGTCFEDPLTFWLKKKK
jgi:uncharacterized protein (DUF2164 family)